MYAKLRVIMDSGSLLGYFLQAVPVTVFVGAVYFAARLIYLKIKELKISWGKETVLLFFVCYETLLFNMVVTPEDFWLSFMDGLDRGVVIFPSGFISIGHINMALSIVRFIGGEVTFLEWFLRILISDVGMFLPLGFFLPLITQKVDQTNIWKIALTAPIVTELIQAFTGRSFDVEDLLLGFVFIMLGFSISRKIKKRMAKRQK